ncbi:PhaM family polyhydroxyalkanoate granule multifunctional regulatory protein [Comamonas testosteroni]|uniref:PhaM family polyhydroxyalkanoate granule multifunctional regulatory protein n=1 Tax=Comamonas testosteroni TaxID=285 RepID=UPI00391CDE8F
MSGDASAFGFGKFIPGFDFLQGLAQSAGAAANPLGRVPQWVAPTVSVEEVDKRIAELKAVQFWLEQNSRALAATIQALEVQRMTLSTLKDMNVSMSELAKSFPFPGAAQAEPAATGNTGWPMDSASARAAAPEPSAAPVSEPEAEPAASEADPKAQAERPSQAALSQAMQWWGALTQQFQQIAAKAMAEPVPPETLAAAQRATEMASGFAKSTMEKVMAQAGGLGAAAAAKSAAQSAAAAEPRPARKAAVKTGQPKTAASKTVASKTAAAKKTASKQPAAKKTAAKTSATSRKP